MPDMTITPLGPGRFGVQVPGNSTMTSHVVTVPQDLIDDLGINDVEPTEIVRATFVFLLEREPPSSILKEFSLGDVPKYFPEFNQELAAAFGR